MATKKQPVPRTYEEAERELNQIVSDIEAGEIGLEDSLIKYERGRFLLQHCRGVLERAEQQIELLSKGADGELKMTRAEGLDDGDGGDESTS
ncbi:MAG TPA: exodeoxyribonuclease VII small subunit [Tepidisphaeraceae bacterium]|jgi:exodeoxyribonuclease VII small subunit|nr:exodeoxyribonuclease VII small subunit [Tepidisphaeraceae bacterium]